eukprot:CAMPEP_0196590612 /NCGR_PEP_ID=MMETSP1081-20130531/67065_1 /TAXON_ID=36882 /ORGANISM="Pyramimonas amylifera, Strain CCMP720" /LENGTH=516 /DNA_ID=CAMNT_0041913763 /DNA_START=57 /DNA_END=1607 /DNA_ORIENTATION=+
MKNYHAFQSCRGIVKVPPRYASKQESMGVDTPPCASVATELVEFLNQSWTHFHAVEEAKTRLEAEGFVHLSETEEWSMAPCGKYFVIRNGSALVAFTLGGAFRAGAGFQVVAAHTDSPCPKLKPVSSSKKGGFLKVGVQTYGGGLWYTWFDRDLSVAGRVLVRGEGGQVEHKLVRVDRPILRIPTLAIHLDRNVNTEGFKPNTETHFAPLLATTIKAALCGDDVGKNASIEDKKNQNGNDPPSPKPSPPHHQLLLNILAEELGCSPESIIDFELNVCDTQPSLIAGAAREFIFSGRLDNLAMSFCSIKALIEASRSDEMVAAEHAGWMVALFDNEEVGSDSAHGASSPMMYDIMKRVTAVMLAQEEGHVEGALERSTRNSFIVSADMAHALHPNYMDKHEENHQPQMHKGLVVKHNANQRYATTAVTSFLFREVARQEGIPTQDFVVRNDMGCGSTIGPILASGIGIRTVDVGMPQLSMHSIREMCGIDDVDTSYRHFKAFFENFSKVNELVVVDK